MAYRDKLNGEPLSASNVHKVFEYDSVTGKLYRLFVKSKPREAGTIKGINLNDFHLVTNYGGRQIPVTHIIWLIVYGRLPILGIEHKDMNPSNNRLDNLREANQSQNMANIGISLRNKSGIKGVSWDKTRHKWYACIVNNYKTINIGRFDSIEEAKEAYRLKAIELFGEFART